MTMKKLYSILVLLLLTIGAVQGQDVHFSQFYETSILRNPALTGIFTGDYKVGAIYRNQWSSISKPFQTALVSGEVKIPVNEVGDFVSIGILAFYDKAGSIELKTLGAYPAVNYNKSLEDGHNSFLSVGFTGGYMQRTYDPTKMTFNNQYQNNTYNAANPSGERLSDPKINNWDLGAGISFSSTAGADDQLNYFVGIAGYHFTNPNQSFENNNTINLDMRWVGSAGLSTQLSDIYGLHMYANYTRQGSYQEIIAGGLISWNKMETRSEILFALYGGVFYRYADALVPTVKLKYKDYAIGVSYDLNVSKLKAATNLQGGLEISVFKTGFFRADDRGRTLCPMFWN